MVTKTTYMENTKCFEIDEIDIDKIRVSDKSLYQKQINHTNIMYSINITVDTFH